MSNSIIYLKGKYNYINNKTNKIICSYDIIKDFHAGVALVSLNTKWGAINKQGKEIIPCIYDYIQEFEVSNISLAQLYDKWGYIDKTGKEIIPFIYEDAYMFVQGNASVKLNGNWYKIDTKGIITSWNITDYADYVKSILINKK